MATCRSSNQARTVRHLTSLSLLTILVFGSMAMPAFAQRGGGGRPDGVGGGRTPTSPPGNPNQPIPSRGNAGRNSGVTSTTSPTLAPSVRFAPSTSTSN